jgi:hypothetical protein
MPRRRDILERADLDRQRREHRPLTPEANVAARIEVRRARKPLHSSAGCLLASCLWLRPGIWIDANAQVEDAADLVGRRPTA